MSRAGKIISLWLPVLAWCWLIFYLSSIPNLKTDLGTWDFILRKIAHMTEYAILFLLFRRALANSTAGTPALRLNMRSILFSVLYAASDEFQLRIHHAQRTHQCCAVIIGAHFTRDKIDGH
jgi:hypothetical protein